MCLAPGVPDAACVAGVLCRIYILAELLAAVLACSIFAAVSGAQHTVVQLMVAKRAQHKWPQHM
jgi:hypothetical protein